MNPTTENERAAIRQHARDVAYLLDRPLPVIAATGVLPHPAELEADHDRLTEAAARILERAKAEDRDVTASEQTAFDALHAVIRNVGAHIREIKRNTAEPWQASSAEVFGGSEARALAPTESFERRIRQRALTDDARLIDDIGGPGAWLRAALLGPRTQDERRALGGVTDSAGGYSVPDLVFGTLVDRAREQATVVRAGAQIVPIESDKVRFAKVLTDPAIEWRAENIEIVGDDFTFGQVEFVPKTGAVLVKASRELMMDSVNLETELPLVLARIMATGWDRVALVGDSADGEPVGLQNMSGVGINVVDMGFSGAPITSFEPLTDGMVAILEDNRPAPTAAIMSPREFGQFAKLVSATEGQPLQRPAELAPIRFMPTAQVPIDMVKGNSIDASQIYLGGFADLLIGMRSAPRLQVLQERYGEFLQVGLLIWMRLDVQVRYGGSFAIVDGVTATSEIVS